LARHPTDYGLGVHANNRFSVEQYIRGHMIGCDVFTAERERILLGINDRLMIPLLLRDNLDENGASIWMRRGGRAERQLTMAAVLARL
jgi:hypothetical protein